MQSITMRRLISVILAAFVALPIWQLSDYLLWGVCCALTTFFMLDIILVRRGNVKIKIAFLFLYVLSMLGVLIMLFTQVL